MHHIKVIKDGNVNNVVKEQLVDGVQYVDNEPHEGSLNGITSDAVAKVAGNVGEVKDVIPEGTTKENPLVNAASLKILEEKILSIDHPAANTLRFEFSKMDYDPTVAVVGSSGTWKKLSAKFINVWDWTGSGTSFASAFADAFKNSDNLVSLINAGDTSTITSMYRLFYGCTSLISITLFDTSSVTSMEVMFRGCTSLTRIPLFNTSSVTNMFFMLADCTSLTRIPLFNTSSVTNMGNAFNGCVNVEDGALELYQQASTQETPPSATTNCFKDCGKDTVTGAAELAQIPASWGGTAPAALNMGAPQNIAEPLSPSVIDGNDSLTK